MWNRNEARHGWTIGKVHVVATTALLVGAVVGYVVRPSFVAHRAPASSMQQRRGFADGLKSKADNEAAPLLQNLKANPNDDTTLIELGHLYYRNGQFPIAITYYERAVIVKPNSPRLLTDLGNACYYSGDVSRAIKDFDSALRIEPTFADALFNRGMVRWQALHDPQAAIKDWEELLESNPNHPKRAGVEELIAQAKAHMSQLSKDSKN